MTQSNAIPAYILEVLREAAAELDYFAKAYDHAATTRDRIRTAIAKAEGR